MSTLRTRPLLVGLVALSALVMLLAGCGSDESETTADTTESSPSTSTSTSTTVAPTSTPSTSLQSDTAVWPFASSSTRYNDPVDAARSFVVSYLGFVDPEVGSFQPGDPRSGEVAIRPSASGPETTVLVRQLAPDDSWWVLGASTPNLRLQSPAALAVIGSPVTLSGQSTAFEATVDYQVRQSGSLSPLADGFLMGGSNGEMGPFSEIVSFTSPTALHGAIILSTASAEDGTISEATVVAVAFS